jgi:hypothetical protein
MLQLNRFLQGDWVGFGLPFLLLIKLFILIVFLIGCATPKVEVGKVTIVVEEPVKIANKGKIK